MSGDSSDAQDSRALRNALGCYATGVAVITTQSPAGVAAITVNSFASVSLAPPLVLWSLGDQSDAYDVFSTADVWGVTVLAAEDENQARRFGQKGRACAEASECETLGGAPVLEGGIAAFGCRTFERRRLGDHLLIVGEVQDFRVSAGPGLSFFRGAFGEAR